MANRVGLWAHGAVAVGAVTWTFRGQARVSAVVKAAFDLTGQACPAETLRPVGVAGWGTGGLLHPRDWAPFRPGVDVLVEGRAVAPGAQPRSGLSVTLRVLRRAFPILDKRIKVLGPAGPAGLGALPAEQRARAASLGPHDVERLAHEPIALPDDFDWRYFRLVPEDQQLRMLHGDEHIMLGGVRTEGALRFTMPDSHAVATVAGAGGDPAARALVLVVDTIELDADRGCYALVWRGSLALQGDEAAHAIHAWLGQQAAPEQEAITVEPDDDDDSTLISTSRPGPWARGGDEITRVAMPRPKSEPQGAPRPMPRVLPFRPDAAPHVAITEARDVEDDERGPDSSGTRPMLPIDHLLAIGRRAVPYDEALDGETQDTAGAPTRRPVVDARAWMAERSPRGPTAADAKLAIKQTGPSLDDAPPATGPLPAIVMPRPERPAPRGEPYDDEVTALRPYRAPTEPTPKPEPVEDKDEDATTRESRRR